MVPRQRPACVAAVGSPWLLAGVMPEVDAISAYVFGLSDGVTVWAMVVAPTFVKAIQWPYGEPFEPDFDVMGFGTATFDTERSTTVRVQTCSVSRCRS